MEFDNVKRTRTSQGDGGPGIGINANWRTNILDRGEKKVSDVLDFCLLPIVSEVYEKLMLQRLRPIIEG